jgi:hypothetical protein
VRRHYSKDNAKAILADAIMYLAGSNWDDWMDSKLAFLVVLIRSYKMSLNRDEEFIWQVSELSV